jgi:hypothetical protein
MTRFARTIRCLSAVIGLGLPLMAQDAVHADPCVPGPDGRYGPVAGRFEIDLQKGNWPGYAFLTLRGGAPNAPGVLMLGERAVCPGIELPMIGEGGALLVEPLAAVPLMLDAAGSWFLTVPMPTDKGVFFLQAAEREWIDSLDPWRVTRGLRVQTPWDFSNVIEYDGPPLAAEIVVQDTVPLTYSLELAVLARGPKWELQIDRMTEVPAPNVDAYVTLWTDQPWPPAGILDPLKPEWIRTAASLGNTRPASVRVYVRLWARNTHYFVAPAYRLAAVLH